MHTETAASISSSVDAVHTKTAPWHYYVRAHARFLLRKYLHV